ncbi:sensor histidine kinase [Pseudooceanicola sp. CBS1P-1]|uniref:histidine kinase n=1 Tax=Pseudooceanicola albus TaxID=2692189 RepID=A0A6L7G4P5_9RHOB|nr:MULTISPECIES: ATP-binding protein [Pseudooceanicola]MBT9385035.1 sensor histidine kinase [Pseudooceanicola endophyticus]MXN18672.1 sensor histidine kinase [Pseudooceanicola albus]
MTPTPPSVLKRLPGWIWPLAAGLVLLALVWLIAFEVALAGLRAEARTDARTRALSIASELSRQQTAGAVLASDPQVVAAQKAPSEAAHLALSRRLEALNDDIGASVLYVTDDQGNATSASNWDEDGSFVGSSYGYRAYVTQALTSGEGREYALGSVSHRPGLYLSRRIGSKADPLGVVVVKLEFHALEANWRASARPSYVVDATGTVTLTSDPALRFQRAPATGHWSVSTPVPRSDWALVLTLPRGPVYLRAAVAVLVVALMLAGGLLLWQGMRRRQTEAARYRDRLERAVETRTRALSQQIHEREEAEAQLAGMQAALVQANKLASLGQISAGVAHEINQPLSTIRLLAEYGQDMLPEGDVPVRENLCQIVAMSHRIETITSDLKGFARKARGEQAPVSLAEAWLASLRLAASRRASNPVEVRSDPIPADLRVMAETVRLEQVLVNLLQNAQEALAGREDGRINMRLEVSQERVRIWISDNGPGLAPQVAEAPFTPFQTTKPGGLGLGLVICQGIVRDFGGDLRPDPRPGLSGACFRLELQRWSAP